MFSDPYLAWTIFQGFAACLLLLITAGCQTIDPAQDSSILAPEASAPAASPEPTSPSRALQLWIPSELWAGPSQNETHETATEDGAASTSNANDWIRNAPHTFETAVKPGYGSGDIASFLASTHSVSPDRLPDLAIVPLSSVTSLRELGVIQAFPAEQPWLEGIDSSPNFARDVASIDDQFWTVPLAIDLALAIGRDREVPSTLDLSDSFTRRSSLASGPGDTSDQGLASDTSAARDGRPADRIIIPIGGAQSTELAPLLALYAGFGGELSELPSIDAESPATLLWLEFLQLGLSSGHIESAAPGLSLDSAWNTFLLKEAPLAVVRAGRLIDQTESFPGLTWASIPGPDDALPPLAWGWGLVLTHRPEATVSQQVIDLGQWLTGPQCTMQWVESGHFPADNSSWALSFAGLDTNPDKTFLAFVHEEFERALPLPDAREWGAAWAAAGTLLLEGADTTSVLAALDTP